MTHEEFWNQEPPYFLRRVLDAHAKAIQDAEEKEAKKAAKKAAKATGVPVEVVTVAAEPKPLGYVWVCEKCKAAPRKHPDWPNNYKWKREKNFLAHKCLG
jgi:hypothetical protein